MFLNTTCIEDSFCDFTCETDHYVKCLMSILGMIFEVHRPSDINFLAASPLEVILSYQILLTNSDK